MPKWWQRAFRQADDIFMEGATWANGHRPSLLVLMFHGLFRNKAEALAEDVDPYQPFTERDLCLLIEHFQRQGYHFIAPEKMHDGLRAAPKRLLLTFDDGYANNLRALPILRRYGVPATFFVTAGNVASGEASWWDAVYRHMASRGIGHPTIVAERQRLKAMPVKAIRSTLTSMFGRNALMPAGDTDRPLTLPELAELAGEPLVTIGNHSVDHELLTRVPRREVRYQIERSQDMLEQWIGYRPMVIAYPNGNCNEAVLEIARRAGLRVGLTAEPGKSALPLSADQRMQIPRYAIVGGESLARQLRAAEAPISLSIIKNQLLHRRRLRATLR